MSEFYLVRHGQASFGKDNYDQLSELGYDQALWLGQHLKEIDVQFDRVVMGSMLRHRQTAQNICEGLQLDVSFDVHEGLNEYDFSALAQAYMVQCPHELPKDGSKVNRQEYYRLLKKALKLWSNDELHGDIPERFSEFKQRVADALGFITSIPTGGRTLVVSSGGPIAMSMYHTLNLSHEEMIQLNLQVKNTSFSQFFYNPKSIQLNSFNSTSHLEKKEYLHGITYS